MTPETRFGHLREHSWNWFSFHADQRTKMFNYFILSASFLVAAFATAASNGLWLVASIVAALGMVNSLCYTLLDKRNAELVGYGKTALRAMEWHLFNDAGAEPTPPYRANPEKLSTDKEILVGVTLADGRHDDEVKGRVSDLKRGKHGKVLPSIEWLMVLAFLLAFALAIWGCVKSRNDSLSGPDKNAEAKALRDAVDKLVKKLDAATTANQSLLAAMNNANTETARALERVEDKLHAPPMVPLSPKPRVKPRKHPK